MAKSQDHLHTISVILYNSARLNLTIELSLKKTLMVDSPFEFFFGTDESEAEYFVSVQAGGQTSPKSKSSSFTSSEKFFETFKTIQYSSTVSQIRKKIPFWF